MKKKKWLAGIVFICVLMMQFDIPVFADSKEVEISYESGCMNLSDYVKTYDFTETDVYFLIDYTMTESENWGFFNFTSADDYSAAIYTVNAASTSGSYEVKVTLKEIGNAFSKYNETNGTSYEASSLGINSGWTSDITIDSLKLVDEDSEERQSDDSSQSEGETDSEDLEIDLTKCIEVPLNQDWSDHPSLQSLMPDISRDKVIESLTITFVNSYTNWGWEAGYFLVEDQNGWNVWNWGGENTDCIHTQSLGNDVYTFTIPGEALSSTGYSLIQVLQGSNQIRDIEFGFCSGSQVTGAKVYVAKVSVAYREKLEIEGTSVNLKDTLSLLVSVSGDAAADYTDLSAEFQYNGEVRTVTNGETQDDGTVVFTYDGILPQCMMDEIDVTLSGVHNGKTYTGETYKTSIRSYMDSLLELDEDTYKPLVAAVLNYGAAAQTYRNYETDNLAINGLEDAVTELSTLRNQTKLISNGGDTATISAANLLLDEGVKLRFKISDAEEGMQLAIAKYAYDSSGVLNVLPYAKEYVDIVSVEGADYSYAVYPVMFSELDTVYYVYVVTEENENQPVSSVIRYSVESYCAAMQDTEKLGPLVKALMLVNQVAESY